ncbi:MAG: AAA family ATPase [Desulfobacterales bacterium]
MYTQHFQLEEPPFSISPDPRYFFMSPRHRKALDHLISGVRESGGFVLLTGEVGTGKTTLIRCLLAQLPDDVDSVLIFNPRLNDVELLATICDELRIDYPANTDSLKALVDALTEYLLAAHARERRTVLIIDEAQNLSVAVLEQIRLLTNLETTQSKLLQVILVGQPELNRILQRKDLRQFTQRITSRCHLKSLSTAGLTGAYIYHRISVSGGDASKLFTRAVIRKIHRLSGAIPRLINLLCHRALQNAYLGNHKRVNRRILRKVARELRPILGRSWFRMSAYWVPVLVALLIAGAAACYFIYHFGLPRFSQEPAVNEQVPAASNKIWKEKILPQSSKSNRPAGDVNQLTAPVAGREVVASLDTEEPPTKDERSVDSPTFAELIRDPRLTREEAFGRLFSQWKIGNKADGTTDDCDWALQNGLRCLFEKSNWQFMRRLNRPVILEFLTEDTQKRYATLIALDEYRLTLDFGAQRSFPIEQVLPFWHGHYILLWKPPYRYTSLLRPGDRSEAVLWLRQLLNKPVSTVTGDASVFDEELKKRIIVFQTSRGITPDGRLGTHTMIHLNTIANPPDIPVLERVF